jgi:hypothetical protein
MPSTWLVAGKANALSAAIAVAASSIFIIIGDPLPP